MNTDSDPAGQNRRAERRSAALRDRAAIDPLPEIGPNSRLGR
jgi:hypothetical protein